MNGYNSAAIREDKATLGRDPSALMPAYSICEATTIPHLCPNLLLQRYLRRHYPLKNAFIAFGLPAEKRPATLDHSERSAGSL